MSLSTEAIELYKRLVKEKELPYVELDKDVVQELYSKGYCFTASFLIADYSYSQTVVKPFSRDVP